MSDKNKKPIISLAIGGAFFAVPYFAMNVALIPAIGIGAIACGVGGLLIPDKLEDDENKSIIESEEFSNLANGQIDNTQNAKKVLDLAKKQNAQIYAVMNKIDDKELVRNIKEIHETVAKIISEVSKNPEKINKSSNFFNYYLPTTLKILTTYDNIENQYIDTDEIKNVMENTKNMTIKINQSLKIQLSNLFQSEIIDTDAEIKVFDSMLKSDGYNPEGDLKIKYGENNTNEKKFEN